MCARTFRRYIDRYEEAGLDGLLDKRLTQVSHHRAPVDEVLRLADRYRRRHDGWSVKQYYSWYRRDGGARSYSWVKTNRQDRRFAQPEVARGVVCRDGRMSTTACSSVTKKGRRAVFNKPLTVRRGYKRATIATAHKLLRTLYRMLATGAPYRDPHTDYEALMVKRNA